MAKRNGTNGRFEHEYKLTASIVGYVSQYLRKLTFGERLTFLLNPYGATRAFALELEEYFRGLEDADKF